MSASDSAQQTRNDFTSVAADAADGRRLRLLKLVFCAWVILLAVFQFSENTADPDLWGHITFGQEMIHRHGIPKTEIYSWTADGQPWINHEVIAEICLGGAHALMGGTGVLLLKMAIGLLTFALALRIGLAGIRGNGRMVAWGFAALAVVEISFGFSARPQIFTALCVVLELVLLRKIHSGRLLWAIGLPLLCIFWINTHGGALAGIGLLGVACGASTAEFVWRKFARGNETNAPGIKTVLVLWLALSGAIGALFCNPWGVGLVRFIIESVSWLRPEIEEWNPTPLNWDHAAMFIMVAIGILSFALSRRRRPWWEMAVFAAFAILGLRSVRNSPLFALVALSFVPIQLADTLSRFRSHFARWELLMQKPQLQMAACVLFLLGCVGIAAATVTLHKQHPFTMEVPRAEYPVSAIQFIKQHRLGGKLLVFFNWGEMTIFHLPQSKPSIDPRLDTCYSRALFNAHWKFYNGQPLDEKVFKPFAADLALLPPNLAGALTLVHRPGWKAVYYDDTAVVFVRDPARFAGLAGMTLPMEGPKSASQGRAAFADKSPRWNTN